MTRVILKTNVYVCNLCVCVCVSVKQISRILDRPAVAVWLPLHYDKVNSMPGVDGVDLLCRRLMTHGRRQHRTMAVRIPTSVVINPENINTCLYWDASAPGFS